MKRRKKVLKLFKKELIGLDAEIKQHNDESEKLLGSMRKLMAKIRELQSGAQTYEKSNPDISRQMRAIIALRYEEFLSLQKQLAHIKTKQAFYDQKLKQIYEKINNWQKVKASSEKVLSAIATPKSKVESSEKASTVKKSEITVKTIDNGASTEASNTIDIPNAPRINFKQDSQQDSKESADNNNSYLSSL